MIWPERRAFGGLLDLAMAGPLDASFFFWIAIRAVDFFGWFFVRGYSNLFARPLTEIDQFAALAAKRAMTISFVPCLLLTSWAFHPRNPRLKDFADQVVFQALRQPESRSYSSGGAVYCADDQHMRTVDVAAFPFRGGSCGGDHGRSIRCPGSAWTGATATQRLRHRRWHETLSAKRELPGVSWLGGGRPQDRQPNARRRQLA